MREYGISWLTTATMMKDTFRYPMVSDAIRYTKLKCV